MWKSVRLGDVCEIQPKKAQIKERLSDADEVSFMPMDNLGIDKMYPTANQTKTMANVYGSYTYFEDNDVLLAKITPCFENGKLGIATSLKNGVGFGSSEYIVLRCGEEVLPQYIYYHLNQPNFRVEGKKYMSGAVGHKRVPKDFVENFELQLPPLPDQQRIVAKLDAAFAEIDRAIDVAESKYTEVEKLKAALLASALRSEDWKTVKLGEACTFISRGISPKYTEDSGVLVLNQKCIRNHSIDYSLARRHDIGKKGVKPERFIQKGDVLINSTGQGTLGRVAQVREEPPEPTTVDSHVTIVRPNLEKFYLHYFGYALIQIEEELKQSGQGTSGQTELSKTRVQKEFFASYPSDKREQQLIVTKLDAAFAEIDKSAESISQAKANYLALKSAILAQELQPPESQAA